MSKSSSLLAKLPFAPIVAAAFGLVAAILVFATPGWLFEAAIVASGLPAILPSANPPLGDTARLLCAVLIGLGMAAGIWAVLAVISRITKAKLRARSPKARGVRIDTIASPSPHRAPIFAGQELGAPFMSQEAMDVARSELILEVPIEPPVDAAEPEAQALRVPEPVVEELTIPVAEPQPVEEREITPVSRIGIHAEAGTIGGLMSRLDAALSRRADRNETGTPIAGGDIAALRRALGAGR